MSNPNVNPAENNAHGAVAAPVQFEFFNVALSGERSRIITAKDLVGGLQPQDYFGSLTETQISEGMTERDADMSHLNRWVQTIVSRSTNVRDSGTYGGIWTQWLSPKFNRPANLVVGDNMLAGVAPETYPAFTVTAADAAEYQRKFRVYDNMLFDVMWGSFTGHWRDIIGSAIHPAHNTRSGILGMARVVNHFFTSDQGYIDALRAEFEAGEPVISGAEDPEPQLTIMLARFEKLRLTSDRAEFTVKYFASNILKLIAVNTCYTSFRENKRASLCNCASSYLVTRVLRSHWMANKEDWIRNGAEVYTAGAGSSKAKSSVLSTIVCSNCGMAGHEKSKCRQKDGPLQEICFDCRRNGRHYFGHGKTIPCKHKKSSGKPQLGSKNGSNNRGNKSRSLSSYKGSHFAGRRQQGGGGNAGRGKNTNPKRSPCCYPGCKGDRKSHPMVKCFNYLDECGKDPPTRNNNKRQAYITEQHKQKRMREEQAAPATERRVVQVARGNQRPSPDDSDSDT